MATKKKKRKRRHSKRWYIGMRNRIIFAIISLGILVLLAAGIQKGITLARVQINKVANRPEPEVVADGEERKVPSYLRNYDSLEIEDFWLYGTHLNIAGSFTSENSIKNMFLYIVPEKAKSPAEYKDRYMLYTSKVEKEEGDQSTTEKYTFKTAQKVNEGIGLENIETGEYFLMLGVNSNSGMTAYYSLKYKGDNENILYYTLTDVTKPVEERNEKVEFRQVRDYCNLSVETCELPGNVYDFVIDPGHGGTDVGAKHGDYYERDIVLDISLKTKELLQAEGYKVLITRDGTEAEDLMMAFTMYEPNGRVNVSAGSKAKYAISVHLNSNEYVTTGGVQMYVTNKGNISFGKRMAEAVCSATGTGVSNMKTGLQEQGVYFSTLTQEDIDNSNAVAEKYNFEPFDLNTSIDGLFMIRELGGRITGAYMDGRNPVYDGKNEYLNSNQGVECCLAEIGFLSVAEDRDRLINQDTDYARGLAEGLKAQVLAAKTEDHIVTQFTK